MTSSSRAEPVNRPENAVSNSARRSRCVRAVAVLMLPAVR